MFEALFTSFPFYSCLFWTLIFFRIRKADPSKKAFLRFLIASTVLYLCHCAYYNDEYTLYRYLEPVYTLVNLAVYPLFYEYIKSLTRTVYYDKCGKPYCFLRKHWTLIPAIICALLEEVCFILMPSDQLSGFTMRYLYGDGAQMQYGLAGQVAVILFKVRPYIFFITLVHAAIASLKMIKRYNAGLSEYYSNDEGRSLRKTKALVICFLSTTVFAALLNSFGKEFFNNSLFLAIPSTLFGYMLFLLGLVCYKQDFIAQDFVQDMTQGDIEIEKHNKILGYKGQEVRKQMIDDLMQYQQIYTKVNLTITDMAMMLGTNRSYLSQTINQEYGVNFATFINHYRVENAKKIMLQNSYLSDMQAINDAIASSGFAGESTFYRVFRKETGMSPKEWMKKNKAQ